MIINWLNEKGSSMLNEPDWLNTLVERSENKVTSFSVAKYDFTNAYLDTTVLLFFYGPGCEHE
jgi:hypothetical protein